MAANVEENNENLKEKCFDPVKQTEENYGNVSEHPITSVQRLRKRAFPADESLTALCQTFVNHSQPT